MFNFAAFAPAQPAGDEPATPPLMAEGLLAYTDEECIDQDGLIIPLRWRANRERWCRMALSVRKKLADADRDREMRKAEAAARAAKRKPRTGPPATRFTTDYAVKWCRRQGWKIIDRENYDFRNKRHHDLQLGVDVLADDGGQGMVGVQGAGRGERKEHYERFEKAGGVAKANRRGVRVIYLEFERGNYEPILREDWAA